MGLANRVSNIVYNQPLVLGQRTEPGQLVVVSTGITMYTSLLATVLVPYISRKNENE